MDIKQQAVKELACRELESRYSKERDSLYEFMKSYRKEERHEDLIENRHIQEMCRLLESVHRWEIKRLIINIPPRSLKTETVAKMFPVWSMGHRNDEKIIALSYSSTLSQINSKGAKDIYKSPFYNKCFPRVSKVKDDQDTKKFRETEAGGQYYADGTSGTITGIGADLIIIDDPIKPDEADSEVVRPWVNNNYENTIVHRLNDKREGAIVIIMQRLHDEDLCGYLMDKETKWSWEKWTKFIVPALSEWSSFFESRFPIEFLNKLKETNASVFSTQYMQDPVNKDAQEFHEERFKYYNNETLPRWWRIFTVCDPAFSKKESADQSCIITGKFIEDKLYILEYTAWRYDPSQLIDKIIYHIKKYDPEKVGVEAVQAQAMIWFNLKNELAKQKIFVIVEEIRQKWDKEMKIRKLIYHYRHGNIYHTNDMSELEHQLKRFPKWVHDDIIDAEQMLCDIYSLQPNSGIRVESIDIKYDMNGRPFI